MNGEALPKWLFSSGEFVRNPGEYLLRHGSMKLMRYRPDIPNNQTPHEQDECYIIQSGNGSFHKAGEEKAVAAGDAIFVEAGADHRFVSVSDDFSAWVIFWGPSGGEAGDI